MASYKPNETLTENQENQIRMASRFHIDTACKKHPEWGPCFMNIVWNREREGKDLTPVYTAAAWLQHNLGIQENGCLYDSLEVLSHVVRAFERGGRPMGPVFDEHDIFDKDAYLFQVLRNKLLANEASYLTSGRIAFPDRMDVFDDIRLMGEGITEAQDILSRLQSWAARQPDLNLENADHDGFAEFQNRAWRMTNILLTLDDINYPTAS